MDDGDPLVNNRCALNPYLSGGRMIMHRLLWDLHLQSWVSRKKFSVWKDRYKGEKAVILCNGPSLNNANLDLIVTSGCFSFGLNKINLLFERSSFRPSCIVAANSFVMEQNSSFYNQTEIPLFIDSIGFRKRFVASRDNVVFFHSGGLPNGFSKDCSVSINQGHTVTYVALQLAFHMGFESVALVGADHTFATKGPPNKTVDGDLVDKSHFDERYFANVQWQLPDLFESEVAYTRAKKIYSAHGRKIVNCTDGGHLEVFRRSSLEDFIQY